MRLEDRLGRALHEEAEAREVDVQRLYAETQSRLAHRRGRSTGTAVRRTGWSRPALVAAAVFAVAGAGWIAPGLVEDVARWAGPAGTVEGGVEDTFSCPAQDNIEFGPGEDDDSFVPEFPDGAADRFAHDTGAARYEFERDGESATLRLGNADGSLSSVSTLRLVGDRWEPVQVVRCEGDDGILVPVADADRLGVHGGPAWDPALRPDPERYPGTVVVDDRAYYDVAGVPRRRMIWVEPCGRRVCLTAGIETSHVSGAIRAGAFRPQDKTFSFLPPDDMVGRRSPYLLYAVYDRLDEVARVSWDSRAGDITWVEPVARGGWQGQLFLVLAPYDEFGVLTVHPRDGEARNFTAEQIPDR